MKTRCPHYFRNATAFLVLLLALTANIFTQPQYYNFQNVGASNNGFPFNVAAGKEVQWLIPANSLNMPNPVPAGNQITKMYFFTTAAANPTYSQLLIRIGQSSITQLPTGAWYTGQLDTHYYRASVSMSSTANGWMSITLDNPFPYNPSLSMIVEVSQCGTTGTGPTVRQNTIGTLTRSYSGTTGCPNAYSGQDGNIINFGVDVVPFSVTCSYSWANQTSGVTSLFYSVKAVNGLVGWAAGAGAIVRRTTDGGTTWTNANPNPGVITGDIYNIEALDANTAFVTTSPGATFIYKTTNGGTNWTQVYTIAGGFINTIRMTSATNGFAFGDPLGGNWLMLKTTDGGSTWTTLATVAGTGDGRNNCLQILGNDIWFGTGQNTVWHSTNLGLNWTSATVTGITGQITGIQFNTASVGIVGGATMSKTTDGGATWTLLPASGTGTISGIEGSGNDYWYVRGTTIYRSTDLGTTWTLSHTHTGAQNDISLATDGVGCLTGWSAGATGTIAKMTGVPVGINDPTSEIPSSYSLMQNYPNPFNPTTSITFAMPVAGNVELKVYDLLGKEVASLVSGNLTAGTHVVPFDASALASGVYIYKLTSGSFIDSKKMVLIK